VCLKIPAGSSALTNHIAETEALHDERENGTNIDVESEIARGGEVLLVLSQTG
jgi:hypothetical protein